MRGTPALAAALLLGACGCGAGREITVLGVWGGSELDAFRDVARPWEQATGCRVAFEGTRDLSAVLAARVEGGNPPDLAILPNAALLRRLAAEGRLVPLGSLLEEGIAGEYDRAWLDLATVEGQLCGLPVKASPKGLVWFSPATFASRGWKPPEDPPLWTDLVALAAGIHDSGAAPWALGVESGSASGWPASDWIQEILLHASGPDVYDRWVTHRIPWTDPAVRGAFEAFGRLLLPEGHVGGGATAIVATDFKDAAVAPFVDPPRAAMTLSGSFAQGLIATRRPDLRPGAGYDFRRFPTIDPAHAGALTCGADFLVVLRDGADARSFAARMARGESWRSWAQRGGFLSPSRGLGGDAYPDEVSARMAGLLAEASLLRYDADDMMPPMVQRAFWRGLLRFVREPHALAEILADIEQTARAER